MSDQSALHAVVGTRRLRRGRPAGTAVQRAWRFDAPDTRDREWWPQGIAWAGDRLLVSWYAKSGGARISVLDLAAATYEHVRLMQRAKDGRVSPLHAHAGGLGVHGPWVHVANTSKGAWSLHFDDLAQGEDGWTWTATARHRPDLPDGPGGAASGRLRYSFIDACDDDLVVGEYGWRERSKRLATVQLVEGLPTGRVQMLGEGPSGMQGTTRDADGRWWATTSFGPVLPGTLWHTRRGSTPPLSRGDFRGRRLALPPGPEDLTHGPDGRLWTVTEFPHLRWIVCLVAPES
ncbi:hypothetical protein [Nocardioides acrostichi]|uniref:Uncharacterized protein n=1 Tax=Nocardioides acrostichi TaxID=2784339 RepID=A0A930YDE3_9ACTN|nr:hypothetical protein [Nocardioides acrostichi]MBF4162399.1 hypothetical protein [Nocardioides acrostichi]